MYVLNIINYKPIFITNNTTKIKFINSCYIGCKGELKKPFLFERAFLLKYLIWVNSSQFSLFPS